MCVLVGHAKYMENTIAELIKEVSQLQLCSRFSFAACGSQFMALHVCKLFKWMQLTEKGKYNFLFWVDLWNGDRTFPPQFCLANSNPVAKSSLSHAATNNGEWKLTCFLWNMWMQIPAVQKHNLLCHNALLSSTYELCQDSLNYLAEQY